MKCDCGKEMLYLRDEKDTVSPCPDSVSTEFGIHYCPECGRLCELIVEEVWYSPSKEENNDTDTHPVRDVSDS